MSTIIQSINFKTKNNLIINAEVDTYFVSIDFIREFIGASSLLISFGSLP